MTGVVIANAFIVVDTVIVSVLIAVSGASRSTFGRIKSSETESNFSNFIPALGSITVSMSSAVVISVVVVSVIARGTFGRIKSSRKIWNSELTAVTVPGVVVVDVVVDVSMRKKEKFFIFSKMCITTKFK